MPEAAQSTAHDFALRFLGSHKPFSDLPPPALAAMASQFQLVRYGLGQNIVSRKALPPGLFVVTEGRVRSLAIAPGSKEPVPLQALEPGHCFGWVSLLRNEPCETVIASTDATVLILPKQVFETALLSQTAFQETFRDRPSLLEVFDSLAQQARPVSNLRQRALELLPEAKVQWKDGRRSVELPADAASNPTIEPAPAALQEVPSAPPAGEDDFPVMRGEGELAEAVACFEMACAHLQRPFRREVMRRVLGNQLERNRSLSLAQCGTLAEMAGLEARLLEIPPELLPRIDPPALIMWEGGLCLLFEINPHQTILGSPRSGLLRLPTNGFLEAQSGPKEILSLKPLHEISHERFSLRWFLPSIRQHRRVLIEVLIASFFVQLFTLANPLITQVIIDKVLVQKSLDTLHVLGALMIIVAIFGSVLTALRTYLFVDTTNRIDFQLGSRIIIHLYRLTLRYFQKRPVGELSTRLNELENVRQFLTGTALTLVLDAAFAVVYVAVMLYYDIRLTAVALAAVPLLAVLTAFTSPLLRRQIRDKAERQAKTQAHLVETLTGVQTLKAQNLELQSRWKWQEAYANYVDAGFRSVLTATTSTAASTLLSRLSELAVLWYGAYLVIGHQLTLGQLIAFRIIAGYVTTPLMRLSQSWQNFQEIGVSLERLGDVVEAAPEETPEESRNIPMPPVDGAVEFQGVTFSYSQSPNPQLRNVSFSIPSGSFVGVVGQSGSGKSTMMKLLPRLYPLDEGRIFIDQYDIAKVELYSLRRQLGVVLQDTLLFDGSVQENIALADPEATSEQIVAAAKVAEAHEFIMGLSAGYNTRIGEQGRALSGGQRQRIAIARTVLQNPRLLILDEATSALDYPTERRVCLNLAASFKSRTVFFVTHRLRSIQHASVILVMDNGVLAERGTHAELMALKGRYFALYQQQGSSE